jgi:hypothetical protein
MTKRRPMTEQEWLTEASPYLMIQHLHQHANISKVPGGQRRLRLFRCACCRAIWDVFNDELCREAVEVSERCADRKASRAELVDVHQRAAEASQAARQKMGELARRCPATDPAWKEASHWHQITSAAEWTASTRFDPRVTHIVTMSVEMAWAVLAGPSPFSPEVGAARQEQERIQAQLLRDIFGNPFQPLASDPAWLTALVRDLAAAAYEQRCPPGGMLDSTRLGVLADALEDAGCTEQAVLAHLRGTGPHVRGCHVLDALLGRT